MLALTLLAGEQEHNHLDSFLELGFHHLDPVVRTHAWLDFNHLRLRLIITTSGETLCHGRLKLVGDLAITISVEDGPVLELSLGEHLALDLAVDFTSTLLNVEASGST